LCWRSFGGGNAAQSNQAAVVIENLLQNYTGLETTASTGAIIGLIMAVLVGLIIIGGIKRIASVTEKVVPFMAVLYIVACIYILLINFSFIDDAIFLIMSEAFNPKAVGVGGIIGVLMVGFKRAAFSNEAGAGSASIAHSAVKTKYSASEGLVALLEPFIDTVVICTMTALVIITFNSADIDKEEFKFGDMTKFENTEHIDSDADGELDRYDFRLTTEITNEEGYIVDYDDKIIKDVKGKVIIDGKTAEGAEITQAAFSKYIPFADIFLAIAVFLFAISTMISWSYYGLQSWKYLFGRGKAADLTYKFLFLAFVVIGAAASMSSIWAFSDAMIFAMVSLYGWIVLLFPVVKNT